jgi:hypothetical protein
VTAVQLVEALQRSAELLAARAGITSSSLIMLNGHRSAVLLVTRSVHNIIEMFAA